MKGAAFLLGTVDGSLHLYNTVNSHPFVSLYGHTESITGSLFSSDGKSVISVSEDCSMKVWRVLEGEQKISVEGSNYHKSPILSLTLLEETPVAVTGDSEGIFCLANYQNGKIYHQSIPLNSGIEAISYSKKYINKSRVCFRKFNCWGNDSF